MKAGIGIAFMVMYSSKALGWVVVFAVQSGF